MRTSDAEKQALLTKSYAVTTTWASVVLAGAVYGLAAITNNMDVVILQKEGEDPSGLTKQEVTEAQSFSWVTYALACLLLVPASDILGRKWTYLSGLFIILLGGMVEIQAHSMGLFTAGTCLMGAARVTGLLGYMLAQESLALNSARVACIVLVNVAYSCCGLAVPIAASMARSTSWRHMLVLWLIPFLLVFLLGPFILIEPKHSTPEVQDANEVRKTSFQGTDEGKRPLRLLLGKPVLVARLLSHVVCWTATCVGYYGLSYASGQLSNDFYADLALLQAMDLVSYCSAWFVVQAVGIITGQVAAYAAVTVSLAICAFLPAGPLRVAAGLVGRWSLNVSYTTLYLSLIESFPAECRGTAGGIANFVARTSCAITPWIAMMPLRYCSLLMSALCAVAGLSSLLLPEAGRGHLDA